MSKILAGVVGLGVVVVGGYFLFSSNKVDSPVEEQKVSFSDFIKGTGSYKCIVNQSVSGVNTQGTTYINNGMIRGEYSSQVQSLNIKTTLIVRDGYTYTWSSMTPNMGFKSKVNATGPANTDTDTSGSYSFNAEQIGDYSCEDWAVDPAMFTLPSGVTFTEVGA